MQLLYGMSRKDTRKIICHYLHEHVFRHNPFTEFDDIGIGSLLTIAPKQIREVNPDLRLSAIGYPTLTEKGRQFCSNMGINMLIGPQYLFHTEKLFGATEECDPATETQEPSVDTQ